MHQPLNPSERSTKHCQDSLAAYVRLWAALQFQYVSVGGFAVSDQADAVTHISLGLAMLAAWNPSVPFVTIAFFASVVRYITHMPFLPNGDWWGCQWDLSGALLFGIFLASARTKGRAQESIHESRRALMEEYASLARVQCIIIWIGIACWKTNTSFLDYRVSCAPLVFFKVLVQQWCPEPLLSLLGDPELWAYYLVRIAPGLTLVVEWSIPLLFSWPGRPRCLGVLLALAFHLGLGPWGAGFSNKAIVRYFLFVPGTATVALLEVWWWLGNAPLSAVKRFCNSEASILPSQDVSACLVVAVVLTVWCWITSGSPFSNAPFLLYVLLAVVLIRASYLEAFIKDATTNAQENRSSHSVEIMPRWCLQFVRWTMLCISLAYSLAFPMMGIQDMGVPNMFSNIALHGGSNHLFLPTGLLQKAFNGANPTHGNPLAGGIVRVELTNSSILNELYPAEITQSLSNKTRSLLSSSGHISRQWGGDGVAWLGPDGLKGVPMPEVFTRYTLPALELRRGLQLARAHREAFYIEYTRLPAQVWRPKGHVSMKGARISYREDLHQRGTCLEKVSQEPCGEEELVLLPPPESSWMGWLVSKLSISNAYAIIPGYETEVVCNAS